MADLMSLYADLHGVRAQDPTLQGVSQAEIMGMLEEALMQQRMAQEYRNRPQLGGAAGGWDAARRGFMAGKAERDSLATLKDAYGKQAGIDQYQQQLQAIQQQIAEAEKRAAMEQAAQAAGWTPGQAQGLAMGIKPPEQPKETTLIQNLKAMGVDPNSPEGRKLMQQYLTKSGVTVNTGNEGPQIGTIPQGFQLTKDESGAYRMGPIPGGPAELEQQEARAKAQGRQKQVQSAGNVVMRETGRALDLIGKMHQGEDPASRYWRAGRAKIKGTPEEVMMTSVLGPIKAELAFARLQTMRENSPTGGALGNVSNFEVDNLQKTAGLFDADMPLDMLRENIIDLRHKFLDTIHGTAEQRAQLVQQGVVTPEQNAEIEALYQESAPQQGGAVPVTSPEEAANLPPGTIYVTPDGKRYKR